MTTDAAAKADEVTVASFDHAIVPPSAEAAVPRQLTELYAADEVAWLEEMSRLAKAGQHADLDLHNLAEYLESMALRERRETYNRLKVLIAHLLKWEHQPSRRSRSWSKTIFNQRDSLTFALTATLRRYAEEDLLRAYKAAVGLAARETKLARKAFPLECPYTLDQILTEKLVDDPADEE